MLDSMLKSVRKSIYSKLEFDIAEVKPIKNAKNMTIPVMFGHGLEDVLIDPSHSQDLYKAYRGKNKFINLFEGDHNSDRPFDEFLYPASKFFEEFLSESTNEITKDKRNNRK